VRGEPEHGGGRQREGRNEEFLLNSDTRARDLKPECANIDDTGSGKCGFPDLTADRIREKCWKPPKLFLGGGGGEKADSRRREKELLNQ